MRKTFFAACAVAAAAALTVPTSATASAGSARQTEALVPSYPATGTSTAAVPRAWRQLPTDAKGLRHYGKWTIANDGAEFAAAATAADCLKGYLCFFQQAHMNADRSGWIRRYRDVQSGTYIGATFDNQMSSYWNRTSHAGRWFYTRSTLGTNRCITYAGGGTYYVNVLPSEDNKLTAFSIYAGKGC